MARLTERKIESITKPGRYGDGHCLFLRVAPGGSKQWVQRLTIHGVRRDIGLGGWPVLSLHDARMKALQNRKVARIDKGDPTGGGPMPTNPTPTNPTGGGGPMPSGPTVPTFQECAERAHKANRPRWRAEKHAYNWIQSLRNFVFPAIGALPVDQVTGQHVLGVVAPLWENQTDKARRVRQRIRTVLGWALAHGYVTSNAAGDGIDGALPRISNGTDNHFDALPHAEVGQALATVEASRASQAAKLCLRFLTLNACRSGEARGARWSEIDDGKALWVIPAERMKTGQLHRVPLSAEAVAVLAKARALDDGSGLVFPSPLRAGAELSNMTLLKALRRCGAVTKETVHGFRSSFRMWCAETNKEREIAEAALAHVVGGVEGRYQRSDVLELRRSLMQGWADYLSGRQPVAGGYATSWDQVRAS